MSTAKKPRNKNPKTEHLAPYAFKPGQSGNPGGKPKSRRLTAAYMKRLEQENEAGVTGAEEVAESMFNAAKTGDVRAAALLGDRTEGRPMQMVKLETDYQTPTHERIEEIIRLCAARAAATDQGATSTS